MGFSVFTNFNPMIYDFYNEINHFLAVHTYETKYE